MKDQELTPLRIVLQNFLNHIETLESKSCENSYESEFQHLKNFSESVKGLKQFSCSEGEKEVNRKKNRYKDILPFDVSRVVLNEYAGVPGSDYINANFIKGASGSPAYIACQGPLPNTVNDFWRMVVQCEVQVIVMACNEEEAGKTKCEKYWVDDGDEKHFGAVSVKLLKSSTVCTDFSVRTMRLKYKNSQSVIEERTVCQLHYVAWPDHGVPSVVQPLLDMVRLVRDTQASETLPVLVHCSAGCGRTGTICAIDYVWGLLRTGKLTKDFSLLGLIREMRRQRIAMVQTKEQYVLVHHAVRELFKEQLNMIDSHPYENIDLNGMLKDCASLSVSQDSDCSTSDEESLDPKREDLIVPPLPERPRSFFTSKQEKEVENLNAQQKLLHPRRDKNIKYHQNKMSEGLKNMERIIDKKIHDLPLGHDKSTLKELLKEDIKGTLLCPFNEVENNTSLGKINVKRSKSLKALSYGKDKLSLYSINGSTKERRPSLESNYEELFLSLNVSDPVKKPSKANASPSNVSSKKNVPVDGSASRSDKLSVRDYKKPLVRSHTTLELSHRPYLYVNDNVDVRCNESYKKPINYKLIRSRTHITLERPSETPPKHLNMSKSVRYSVKNPRVVSNGSLRSFHSNSFGKAGMTDAPNGAHPLKASDKPSSCQKFVYSKSQLAKESKIPGDINHSRSFDHGLSQEGGSAVNSSESVISRNHVIYSPIKMQRSSKPTNSPEKYTKISGPLQSAMGKEKLPKGHLPVNGILKSTPQRNPCGRELASRVPSHYLSSPLNKHIDKQAYRHYDHRSFPELGKPNKSSVETPSNQHFDVLKQPSCRVKEFNRLSFPPGKPGQHESKGLFLRGFRPRRKLPTEETISDTDSSLESKNLSLPVQYVDKKEPLGHPVENSPSVRFFYEDKFLRKGQRCVELKSDVPTNSYCPYTNSYPSQLEVNSYSKHSVLPCNINAPSSSRYPYPSLKQSSLENPYDTSKKHDDVQETKKFLPLNHQDLASGVELGKRQFTSHGSQNDFECAPGIDLDKVAASITDKDGSKSKFMKAALDSLHMRKSRESIEKNGFPIKSFPDVSPTMQPSSSTSSSSKKKSQHQYI